MIVVDILVYIKSLSIVFLHAFFPGVTGNDYYSIIQAYHSTMLIVRLLSTQNASLNVECLNQPSTFLIY